MAYERKTKPRERLSAEWLASQRLALLESGMTERELTVIRLRDIERLRWAEINLKLGLSHDYGRAIFNRALRKLRHPFRVSLLPPSKRS